MLMPIVDILPSSYEEKSDASDRIIEKVGSIGINLDKIDREDMEKILTLMPNERYRTLIRLRYIELMTNEETAKALGMTMDNYYNIHKRAKAQFEEVCIKEDYYG